MTILRQTILRAAFLPAACLAGPPFLPAQGPEIAEARFLPTAAREYRLGGPTIHKVNRRSKELMVADFNTDGLLDFGVITNERSMLELFLQREEFEAGADRFAKETVTLDRIVRSAEPMDVNGDGRTDLIITSSPPSIAVMYQDREGRFESPEDLALEGDRLVTADFNKDGRDDLLVYAEKRFDLLMGERRGLSLEPTHTFHTTGEPARDPMVVDLDGDGLLDIVYHDASQFEDVVIRRQAADGTFPSEFRVSSTVLRAVAPFPRPGAGIDALAAVLNTTRVLTVFELEEAERDDPSALLSFSPMQTIPFDAETRSNRTRAITTDLDGDGRLDVVVHASDLSVLRTYRQTRTGDLVESRLATFDGIEAVVPLPVPPGEPTPLMIFSPEENAIGFARMDGNGELPFPAVLPVRGEPTGATVVTMNGGTHLAVTVEDEEGTPILRVYTLGSDGSLGDPREALAEGDNPFDGVDLVGLEAFDLNRDGREDLVAYADFQPAIPLLQTEEGRFEAVEGTSGLLVGLLTSARPSTLDRASGTGGVLAIKEQFARSFALDEDRNVVIKHQFNGRGASSRLVAAGTGTLREGRQVVALLDRGETAVTLYEQAEADGPFTFLQDVDLDGAEYSTLRLVDLNGDGDDEVLLVASDRIGVLYPRRMFGGLADLATLTPADEEEGGYGVVYTADLIEAPGMEFALVEMKDMLLDLALLGEDDEGRPALHRFYSFKMFDSESTLARRVNLDALPEPREFTAADLDGDGRPELVTLMHDNVIVYTPLDPAEDDER